MKKDKLEKFVGLYHLNGMINSTIWNVKDKECKVKILSEDKTVMGTVSSSDIGLEDSEFGIADTSALLNMLKPMENDIEVSFQKNGTENKSITLVSNGAYKINASYPLADISVIPKTGTIKQVPDFQIEIELNSDLVDKVIAIKNSLDSKTFTFNSENGKLFLTVGYVSDIQTNRTTVELPVIFAKQIDLNYKSFNAENLKNALIANKGFKTGKISIFDGGLLRVVFTHDNMESEYYFIQLKTV